MNPRSQSRRFIVASLAVALFATLFSPSARAQFPQLFKPAQPEPYGYKGDWAPSYQPPGWNYPMSQITFRNLSHAPVEIYQVNRHGNWNWSARVLPNRSQTVKSPIGDLWAVRDRSGQVVQRVYAGNRPKVVDVEGQGYYPKPPSQGRKVDLTFRNKTKHRVNLYAINQWENWVWVSRIPARDGEVNVRSFNGQRWKAVDERGKTVKTYGAGKSDDTIVIK